MMHLSWILASRLAAVLLMALCGACLCPKAPAIRAPRCVPEPAPTSYLLQIEDPNRVEERIVVAQVDMAAGTVLRTSLLEVRAQPPGFQWKGHLRPVDLVHFAGQRLQRDVAAGSPIRRADLETGDSDASASRLLPAGARAVTLQVDWVGGKGTWVVPGDQVDIGLVRQAEGAARTSVLVLMQDARVLMAARHEEGGARPSGTLWVSVLALPREAHGLALAQRLGHIVLFPRGASSQRSPLFPPVTLRDLESPDFWEGLRKERQRSIQPVQAPDDPGIRVK